MKRTRLARRTPLRATAGLARTPLRRAAPMRRRPAGPPQAAQDAPEPPGWSEDTRRAVSSRSGGRCEVAVDPRCTGVATDLHHRQRRREGRHDAANAVHCCRWDHRWVHEHPAEARRCGWIVSAWGDPAQVPVLVRGSWVRLGEERTA